MAHCEVSILASEGKHTVSSLQLAEHFGIQHRHVLRDIKAIMRKTPESFNGSNFGRVEYPDSKGEMRPAYALSRDAFTLLAMGYNSARVIAWKLRYIEAFNALEKAALEQAAELARQAAEREGQKALDGIVAKAETDKRRAVQSALVLPAAKRERLEKLLKYRQRGFSSRECALVMQVSEWTICRLRKQAQAMGLGV